MKVIANKNLTGIIKGHEYELISLQGRYNRTKVDARTATVKLPNDETFRCSCKNFNKTNGEILHDVEDFDNSHRKKIERTKGEDLSPGKYLFVKSVNFKYLQSSKIYEIEEVREKEIEAWGATKTEYEFKLKGYNRFIKFDSWKFRLANKEEVRKIRLGLLKVSDTIDTKVDSKVHKDIKKYGKEVVVLKCIFESCSNKYRHTLDVIDWAYKNNGDKYGLKKEDFDSFRGMKLSDIIKQFE